MLRLFPRLMLVVGIGMTGAACQGDGYGAPSGYYPRHRVTATHTTTAVTLRLHHSTAMRSLRMAMRSLGRHTTQLTAVAIPR